MPFAFRPRNKLSVSTSTDFKGFAHQKLIRGSRVERKLHGPQNRAQAAIREDRFADVYPIVHSLHSFACGKDRAFRVPDGQPSILDLVPAGVSRNDALIVAMAALEQASADMPFYSLENSGNARLSHAHGGQCDGNSILRQERQLRGDRRAPKIMYGGACSRSLSSYRD
jgi:hypothetical protein